MELEELYETNPFYNDHAIQMKTIFLEHSNCVKVAVAEATEKTCFLALEMASSILRHSKASSRSRKSSSPSQPSMKTLVLACTAAAAKSAVFEEEIAKRTTDMVSQQAARELDYAKQEAENKLWQTKQDLEQRKSMAAAEADLQNLKARQAAASEKAR